DVRESTALRTGRMTRMHGDAARPEVLARPAPEIVVGERGEEEARAVEVGELNGRDGTAARGLLPGLERVHDLPRCGHVIDPRELHPLDVSDYCDLHVSHLEPRLRFIRR